MFQRNVAAPSSEMNCVHSEASVGLFMYVVQKMRLLRSMGWNEEMEPSQGNR